MEVIKLGYGFVNLFLLKPLIISSDLLLTHELWDFYKKN
jgi:hypothetical protein